MGTEVYDRVIMLYDGVVRLMVVRGRTDFERILRDDMVR